MPAIRIVQKKNNSLYIAIPRSIAEEANITRGTHLIIHQVNGRQLIYTKVQTDLNIPLPSDNENSPYEN